jgi:hypothetical protein
MISVREGFDIIAERGYEKRVAKHSKGYTGYHSNEPHIQRRSMKINPYAKVQKCIMI